MSDSPVDESRRNFLMKATSALGAFGVAAAAVPFLSSWLPSARSLSQGGPVEVDLSHLPPKGLLTVSWRGQPVWIVRRTNEEVEELSLLNDQLRDPLSEQNYQPNYAKNLYRSIKKEFLILIGLCTHLGCVPSYKPAKGELSPNWQGGFYCPCHGSTYDFAGRVFKGVPAPTNLIVPPHQFLSDTVVLVGKDEQSD